MLFVSHWVRQTHKQTELAHCAANDAHYSYEQAVALRPAVSWTRWISRQLTTVGAGGHTRARRCQIIQNHKRTKINGYRPAGGREQQGQQPRAQEHRHLHTVKMGQPMHLHTSRDQITGKTGRSRNGGQQQRHGQPHCDARCVSERLGLLLEAGHVVSVEPLPHLSDQTTDSHIA